MAKNMTRKEKTITELYINTALEVASNADEWTSFLKSASYNYKYRFDEQILIYAQKPEATACAETTVWNKKLKRWINKGSKGIALITENNGEMGLRFVFDVSDTNSNVYGRRFKLWTAEEKYTDDVIEALEDRFGKMENKDNLPFAIMSTTFNQIAENMQDYVEELKGVMSDSNLATLDEQQLEDTFLELLMYSASALVMSRCGIDVNNYLNKSLFSGIEKFNTFETISILGTATRDFSREILLEISKTIINVQKQEKNKNYTFEKNKESDYDKNIENEKGSVKYDEYNLHNERELSNTRLEITRENEQESGIRQIRKNEVELSKGEQERNLYNTSNEQQIDRPLNTNTGNSNKEIRANDRENEETIWNNRENEVSKSDGMDRTDEQYKGNSRASNNKGDNLQLEEQQTEKEAQNASFFDEETIKNILENAPNVEKDKVKFGEFIYDNHEDKEKCKEYIKEVLGNAYTEYVVDGQRVGYKAGKDFLNIWKGDYLNRTEECFKDWDLITEYCISNHFHTYTPEYNKDIYTFMVGDVIYLGLQEFTILDINNGTLTMYDNAFPLDQRIVKTKDIISKIAENPLNDYLKDREIPEKENNSFEKWLDTFIEEKGIDINDTISIESDSNSHIFEIGNIIENIKVAPTNEQAKIKDMLVKIDFNNGSVIDYFRHLALALVDNYEKETQIEEQKIQEELGKNIIKKNRNIEYFDLHPEIKIEDRNNFKIKDDNLGVGTAKEKYKNNIEAIKVLKLCEEQNRYATKEEQKILSKYVGWGGLKSAFEENNGNWANEYYELKNLLTEEEYKNARESSLTAFYTPPVVIRNIYKALQNMGLKQANILEPSCRCRKLYRNVTRRIR